MVGWITPPPGRLGSSASWSIGFLLNWSSRCHFVAAESVGERRSCLCTDGGPGGPDQVRLMTFSEVTIHSSSSWTRSFSPVQCVWEISIHPDLYTECDRTYDPVWIRRGYEDSREDSSIECSG